MLLRFENVMRDTSRSGNGGEAVLKSGLGAPMRPSLTHNRKPTSACQSENQSGSGDEDSWESSKSASTSPNRYVSPNRTMSALKLKRCSNPCAGTITGGTIFELVS